MNETAETAEARAGKKKGKKQAPFGWDGEGIFSLVVFHCLHSPFHALWQSC